MNVLFLAVDYLRILCLISVESAIAIEYGYLSQFFKSLVLEMFCNF